LNNLKKKQKKVMDKKIVKIIFTDGEEESVKSWRTPEELKKDFNYATKQEANRHYNRQFKELEGVILQNIDNDVIKRYAKDYLDLVEDEECDCDETDIMDFEDNHLMNEVSRRKLLGFADVNIVTIDLFERFSRVLGVANVQELEATVSELERKHNL
jgi:hypothetical protein